MADQKKVDTETGANQQAQEEPTPAQISPAVIIGWDPNGEFVAVTRLDPHRALALLEYAKVSILGQINPNKQVEQKKVIGIGAVPPAVERGMRGNGRPH